MNLDMRALYYIALSAVRENDDPEELKGIENCLNQNFVLIAQKLSELNERLNGLENDMD